MHNTRFESRQAPLEKSQFRIWPKTAMLDPTAEELVLAGDPESRDGREDPAFSQALFLCSFLEFSNTLARDEVSGLFYPFEKLRLVGSSRWKADCDFHCKRLFHFLIRIQSQNPLARRLVDSGVFLRRIAFP